MKDVSLAIGESIRVDDTKPKNSVMIIVYSDFRWSFDTIESVNKWFSFNIKKLKLNQVNTTSQTLVHMYNLLPSRHLPAQS